MANNYCQWSEHFTLRNQEEIDWIKSALEGRSDSNIADYLKSKFNIEVSGNLNWPDFQYAFDDKGVTLYSEGYGNLNNLAAIVQAFLTKFQPSGYFTIEWADTCSKPRPKEFGGGAAFITANKIDYLSTITWVEEKVKTYQSKLELP